MNLIYKILWFENEEQPYDFYLPDIKLIVENENFEFEHLLCRKETDFKGKYSDYDLILMDYNLADKCLGSDIIKKIREKSYVDILFYSQNSLKELKQKIFYEGLNGIFYCHRDDFIEKFKNIFDENMKKIHHPNNLRGLVMAETSDLDKLKKKIFKKYLELNHDKKEEFEKKIHEKIEKSIISNIEELNSFRTNKYKLEAIEEGKKEKEIELLIERPIFEFSKKGMSISNLINFLEFQIGFNFGEYSSEIISKRNKLAHEPEEENEGGDIKFGNLIFNLEECRIIRNSIKKYKKIFEEIYQEINKLNKK